MISSIIRGNKGKSGQNRISPYGQPSRYEGIKSHGARRAATRSAMATLNSYSTSVFKPQSGLTEVSEFTEIFESLSDFAKVDVPQNVFKEVEGLTALFFALHEVQSLKQFSAIVFLYIRSHYEDSISSMVISYLSDLFDETGFTAQSNGDSPNWLSTIRNVQYNWNLAKSNMAFKQISKLMGVLVTLGLCKVSDIQFSIGGFKLFDEKLFDVHYSAFDIADALCNTVTYFAEGMYMCFKTGSVRPLLLNNAAAVELDDQYIQVIQWWDLVQNGNLEKFANVSESVFLRQTEQVAAALRNLLATSRGFESKLVTDKLQKVLKILNDYTSLKVSGSIREAPFAIELFGPSSQGKTTFGEMLIDCLCVGAELPVGKEFRAAINASDKFWSNWQSSMIVAKFDDLANETPNFVETPPTRAIIDVMNNQAFYAPKAELEAKGKCFVEPKICLVNTNKKDLDASKYSNCPFSIQRRMHVVITVTARKEFCHSTGGLDPSKVIEHYTDEYGNYFPPEIDDIWLLTIEKAKEPPNLFKQDGTINESSMMEVAGYEPITWRGKKMVNVDALECIACVTDLFAKHRREQANILATQVDRPARLCRCGVNGCMQLKGNCPDHVEPQLGFETAIALNFIKNKFVGKFSKQMSVFGDRLENMTTRTLYKFANFWYDHFEWVSLVPTPYFESPRFQRFLLWWYKDEIERRFKHNLFAHFMLVLIVAYFSITFAVIVFLFGCYIFVGLGKKLSKDILSELKERHDTLPEMVATRRDRYATFICRMSLALAALYFVSRVYRAWRAIMPQGSLSPKSPSDVEKRDKQENVWASVVQRPIFTMTATSTMQPRELLNVLKNNILYAVSDFGGVRKHVNALFVRSNLVLIPKHYFEERDSVDVTFSRNSPDSVGGRFRALLELENSYVIPDTDLVLCYCPNGGTFKDVSKYLPPSNIGDSTFIMLYRNREGELFEHGGSYKAGVVNNSLCDFDGGMYKHLSINTFGGLCGSVIVSMDRNPYIAGVHLGGISGKPEGCFGTLYQSSVREAVSFLEKRSSNLFTKDGEFKPQVLGIKLLNVGEAHAKSPMRFMPEGTEFQFHGLAPGRTSTKSLVRVLPTSEHVMDVCDNPNVYGPPKMNPEWEAYQKALANMAIPAKQYPVALLDCAVEDYQKPLLELARSDMWKDTRPLTHIQTINGIPGVRFVDAMPKSTAIGFPLVGPKSNFMVELPADEIYQHKFDFEQDILAEIERVGNCYRSGERAFTVAKACKKDEVLPLAKGKCRIFYANGIAQTYWIRRLFLPIARMLQMNPLVSECAVGINCYSPEWDELMNHLGTFGDQAWVAGDYSKYDQRLPTQLILAAFRILINIARQFAYDKTDILMMESIATDVAYSMINFNGDLISLVSGSHISGNSLTVNLNGICGSLNLRCAYFAKRSSEVDFRSNVHIVTYGDDNAGSASLMCEGFGVQEISKFLAEYGQTYTMPDKESELVSRMSVSDVEFLKRKSVFIPEIGVHVGALSEDSIFKSLHCCVHDKKSPLSLDQLAAGNVDGAIREWFFHGRDTFNVRQQQMVEVARRSRLTSMCTNLNKSFDEFAQEWYETYKDW
jgi:hypothetical protein